MAATVPELDAGGSNFSSMSFFTVLQYAWKDSAQPFCRDEKENNTLRVEKRKNLYIIVGSV